MQGRQSDNGCSGIRSSSPAFELTGGHSVSVSRQTGRPDYSDGQPYGKGAGMAAMTHSKSLHQFQHTPTSLVPPSQSAVSVVDFPQMLQQAGVGGTAMQTGSGQTSPQALTNALSALQQNIGALQALVPLISQSNQAASCAGGMQQQQQAAAAGGLATVISQLAVAVAGIIPQLQGAAVGHLQLSQQPPMMSASGGFTLPPPSMTLGELHLSKFLGAQGPGNGNMALSPPGNGHGHRQNHGPHGPSNLASQFLGNSGHREGHSQGPSSYLHSEDPGSGSARDDDEGYEEVLPEGSYDVVEMDPVEILAEHTHFCDICGKGFKRDANLRMHMRGHGDEYKTPAALSRPDKLLEESSLLQPRRYSCPYQGCKRNKKHRKFQPLKTILCVKNHYRRSHCPKMLTCGKCNVKKFSVVADLKTHEKHCGRDKWMCSCRTTFSRKDKLLGHLQLFTGHTPALPLHLMEDGACASGAPASEQGFQENKAMESNIFVPTNYTHGSSLLNFFSSPIDSM